MHALRLRGRIDRGEFAQRGEVPLPKAAVAVGPITDYRRRQLGRVDHRRTLGQLPHLAQFHVGELGFDRAASPEQKIEQTFLSILNRKPTSKERELWLADAREGGDAVIKDLVWTLVNTHEFMFVQ